MRMVGAMLALLAASATVLGLGQGLRRLVDDGFKSGDPATLDRAVLALIGVVILLAGSAFCRFYLVSWIGGPDVLAGRISAGDLSAFVFYAVVVAMAVGTLSEVWGDVQRASGAAAAITELLDSVADIRAPRSPVTLPDPALGVVTFEDVGFCYPASPGRSALEGFTITVAQGETVALVGPSGAGKLRSSNCCCGFTTHDTAPCGSMGSICAPPIRRRCASASDWSRRTRWSSAPMLGKTSVRPTRRHRAGDPRRR
jgi:ABC-type transport system involved in cytochrome bd biosynthesis fused ATPase/permease subunit